MTMPDRIWVCPPTIHIGGGQWWDRPGLASIHEFIRADLVDDLRKALEKARERVEHWADVASRADRTRYDTSDDLAPIDAALARIDALKEK